MAHLVEKSGNRISNTIKELPVGASMTIGVWGGKGLKVGPNDSSIASIVGVSEDVGRSIQWFRLTGRRTATVMVEVRNPADNAIWDYFQLKVVKGATQASPDEDAVAPGSSNFPVLLKHPETIIPRLETRTVLHIGGIWGQIKAGQTVMASEGFRFVWSADSTTVVYSQKGKFYVQSARGFIGEITTAPLVEAGRRAEFMARVGEIEMKLLMGIVAGASGVGFAIVIGVEVAEFVAENAENFSKWNRQLQAVLKAREFLKKYAPTLYEKVFNAILNQVYKDVKSKIPDAITPEIVAFGVGVVIGAAGKKLAQGKFSLLAIAFVVVEQIVVRFSLSVVPGAFKLTAEEYRKLADEIIGKMREAGVSITEEDVSKIVEEVNKHSKEIKQAFQMLNEAFGR